MKISKSKSVRAPEQYSCYLAYSTTEMSVPRTTVLHVSDELCAGVPSFYVLWVKIRSTDLVAVRIVISVNFCHVRNGDRRRFEVNSPRPLERRRPALREREHFSLTRENSSPSLIELVIATSVSS